MKILITGATGFIGSNLVKEFIKQGHNVVGITKLGNVDNLNSIQNNPNLNLIKIDLTNFELLNEEIKKENEKGEIDIIYHLAAYLPPIENANLLFETNVNGTFNMLQLASLFKIKKFIYFSSMSIYGDTKYLPVDEDHPTNPNEPYGLSKLLGENLCKFYSGDELNTIVLRCSGVYGPGRNNGAFANFIRKSLNNEEIKLSSDGEEVWDAMYVQDIVNCCVKCLEYIQDSSFKVFNIGYGGEGIKMRKLIEKIIEITGSKKTPLYENTPATLKFLYNISKARNELNYFPQEIEKSLEEYIQTEKEMKKQKRGEK